MTLTNIQSINPDRESATKPPKEKLKGNWRVIGTDNLDRETRPDTLHTPDLTQEDAIELAKELNAESDEFHPTYYKAVDENYVLFKPNH